jgi:hypothetical protein
MEAEDGLNGGAEAEAMIDDSIWMTCLYLSKLL